LPGDRLFGEVRYGNSSRHAAAASQHPLERDGERFGALVGHQLATLDTA
jgi:hypothetical protein